MPSYRYRREDNGQVVELKMTIAQMDRRQRKDGRIKLADGTVARRDYSGGVFRTETDWTHPIHSEAMGVHPEQIPEARRFCEMAGVKTDFDRTGRPIFRSRKHRKRYARAWNFHDRDGGDGDP